jgi:formate hydrogenlyase subunit 3/multisubunit Na+/H+ antiporter MnhD subunit
MDPLLTALVFMVAGGALSLALRRFHALAAWTGAGAAAAGSAWGLWFAAQAVATGLKTSVRLPWRVPYGDFHVGIDPLSSFFLVIVFGIGMLSAIYGAGYLSAYRGKRATGHTWFFFNLLLAGMALVVMARHAVLFLVAWEVMSLASFALVTFDDQDHATRRAGWTYLVATHIGTAFLLALFPMMARVSGSLSFDAFAAANPPRDAAGVLLLLAVVGFGTKAGLMPLHVWLPEAHPAAPSHVSALMSGVMIKMGLYGLLRTLSFLGDPVPWWGWLFIGLGMLSGVLGILYAIAQHDLKRLLAYSSIENMGLIAMGIGLGILGRAHRAPAVAVLGFSAALLHALNHACFKSLLFMSAGSVLHGAGTRNLNALGGLLKKMPWTGAACIAGGAAIGGLPPLNGFLSELLLALAAIRGSVGWPGVDAAPALVVLIGLAAIGGLAAACFAKVIGASFLGAPRAAAASAHESGWLMRLPMAALMLCCAAIAVLAPTFVATAAATAAATFPSVAAHGMDPLFASFYALAALILIVLFFAVSFTRRILLRRRPRASTVTWDCGYAAPAARMQYTGSSFAQPLTSFFAAFLRPRRNIDPPRGFFPRTAAFQSETLDLFHLGFFRPAFQWVRDNLQRLRWIQHGNVHAYVLYVALAVLLVLILVVRA